MNNDISHDSNGGAYTCSEHRIGPPLSYVAEKIGNALISLHSLHALSKLDIPENIPCPKRHRYTWPDYNVKEESVLGPCVCAFGDAVKSYLALYNMLGAFNITARRELLKMSSKEFKRWIDNIQQEGSLTSPFE